MYTSREMFYVRVLGGCALLELLVHGRRGGQDKRTRREGGEAIWGQIKQKGKKSGSRFGVCLLIGSLGKPEIVHLG